MEEEISQLMQCSETTTTTAANLQSLGENNLIFSTNDTNSEEKSDQQLLGDQESFLQDVETSNVWEQVYSPPDLLDSGIKKTISDTNIDTAMKRRLSISSVLPQSPQFLRQQKKRSRPETETDSDFAPYVVFNSTSGLHQERTSWSYSGSETDSDTQVSLNEVCQWPVDWSENSYRLSDSHESSPRWGQQSSSDTEVNRTDSNLLTSSDTQTNDMSSSSEETHQENQPISREENLSSFSQILAQSMPSSKEINEELIDNERKLEESFAALPVLARRRWRGLAPIPSLTRTFKSFSMDSVYSYNDQQPRMIDSLSLDSAYLRRQNVQYPHPFNAAEYPTGTTPIIPPNNFSVGLHNVNHNHNSFGCGIQEQSYCGMANTSTPSSYCPHPIPPVDSEPPLNNAAVPPTPCREIRWKHQTDLLKNKFSAKAQKARGENTNPPTLSAKSFITKWKLNV